MSRRTTVVDITKMKESGQKIVMLTAYDATMASLLERGGVDVLLVGDSLGMVVLGHPTTVAVTLDDMVHHTRAVARGSRSALIVADMPFLSYQADLAEAVRNAGRLIQQGGAQAVKIEGGAAVVETVRRLVEIGIPVMAHLGLTPQSYHALGGFVRQATTPESADRLQSDARLLEEAGAFAIVLEAIPSQVAAQVSRSLDIPTIGIGAGPDCDGQVLVSNDMLGLFDRFVPPFVKQYARLGGTVVEAVREYGDDVRGGRYPARDRLRRSEAR